MNYFVVISCDAQYSIVALFIVWRETTHFERKDYPSYENCIEITEVLQACRTQCWKIYSEGKQRFVSLHINKYTKHLKRQVCS